MQNENYKFNLISHVVLYCGYCFIVTISMSEYVITIDTVVMLWVFFMIVF